MSLANHYNYVVKVIENDRLRAENESKTMRYGIQFHSSHPASFGNREA